jgi:hypothetical protein
MKELSIEEKAKAYDVAIERAKSFIENGDETERTISESIFAGIMDVSEDENIRKELMECLKHNALGYSEQTRNKWFDWLEKQGEQKSNPYSGTSFKYNGHIWGMCARDNGVDILLDSQFLKHFENQGEQKSDEDSCKISDDITTEENDMTEYNKGFECGKQRVLKYPEDYGLCKNLAWSEEDENMLQKALSTIRYALSIPADKEDDPCFAGSSTIAWLKSLKERMKGE